VLVRTRKKGTLCALLGMHTGEPTMENSLQVPWKVKNTTTNDPLIPLLGIHPKEIKPTYQKGICPPMFTAAWFTIAKIRKQPKCPSVNDVDVVHACLVLCVSTHDGILFSHKKEGNSAICDNLDGPSGHCAKWNKSEKDKYCISLIHGI